MAQFTVDTHIFRELGELLVGRDSTALVELIKNAYDADATEIIVNGVNLDNPAKGYITIDDNGVGMQTKQFEDGFLRIASRLKEQGARESKRFKRRFTGAKGIGRLAAHKLAKVLEVYSIPWSVNGSKREAIRACINWGEIEDKETLEDVPPVEIKPEPIQSSTKTGTVITLRSLKRKWTAAERQRFITEARTFEPPGVLTFPLPKNLVDKLLLFEAPRVRESSNLDPGCRIELMGDFAGGDEFWQTLAHAASWVIEIDARKGRKNVRYAIAPMRRTIRENPDAMRRDFSLEHPDSDNGPFFQARILVRDGSISGSKDEVTWTNQTSGVRVFLEGFRVVPYGEPGNDWLGIDADYSNRARSSPVLNQDLLNALFEQEQEDPDWFLSMLRNRSYFGGVFLTQRENSSLKLLVNREGFVTDATFESLRKMVRLGIDLSTRLRAAATFSVRQGRRLQRARIEAENMEEHLDKSERSPISSEEVDAEHATLLLQDAKRQLAAGEHAGVEEKITLATRAMSKLISERAMLRVLASVGTQMASFIHEINSLLGVADSVYEAISRIRAEESLPGGSGHRLVKLQTALGDLKRGLERQASYLLDVVTPDARRRRSRQSLADRFNAGARLVERLSERRGITLQNDIPPDIKSPPMFPAELTTVFSNLLTNAVKASGEGGKIRATATRLGDGNISLRIENTGVAVDLAEAEQWFQPFESTTVEIDPVLGQGMGLGLPITRSMLEEYGAEIRFVQPSRDYATAIEIVFPQ